VARSTPAHTRSPRTRSTRRWKIAWRSSPSSSPSLFHFANLLARNVLALPNNGRKLVLRPLWDVRHPRKRFDKEFPRIHKTADTVVENVNALYAFFMHGWERRVAVYDGHDHGSHCTLEVPVPIIAKRVRQECRSQDCRLLRQDWIIVSYCCLREGCLCSVM
jgi:hypothetical protein